TLARGRKITGGHAPWGREGRIGSPGGRNGHADLWPEGECRSGRRDPDWIAPLDHGGSMLRRSFPVRALALSALIVLLAPAAALADTFDAAGKGLPDSVGINSLWVVVAGCLVMFMQAGFAFLELGFSRGKNAGTVIAKIVTNFSIAGILYWAVGFAFAFGGPLGHIIGTHGFFLRDFGDPQTAFPVMGLSDATIESKWFFQFVFCAVSLAIVWGTTLERIKFGVYIIYAVVFSALIYPIGAHWIFGGGWLATKFGMQDFAASTVVHLIPPPPPFPPPPLLRPPP